MSRTRSQISSSKRGSALVSVQLRHARKVSSRKRLYGRRSGRTNGWAQQVTWQQIAYV
eukprot:CAMPEP_0176095780 /NCGR_PEP_ID=MMETSP0120_2-20121206/48011_1 /TAXON_ID=160619 /ORGANISM="Kryptoperidinium foliaceum, Strain CCMP 1326" /LENGTH=57 /DNA_ID=CAMNT_0017429755 /DNA_START=57 /DNA_END=227 /DNA_ORIENTATION=-